MARHMAARLGLGVLVLGGVAATARAETLADAVALAYGSNPTLQAQRAAQRALDETYVQASAGYNPTASARGIVTTDDNNALGASRSGRPTGQSQTSAATLTITQPIWTGGRVSGAVDAAKAGVLAGRERLRAAEQSVLDGVIQAYADVRRDQESVAIAEDNVALLQRQSEQSRARFEVGEITRTDVAQTEGRVAAARAQRAAALAQLANSRAGYGAVVGQNPGNLAPEPPLSRLLPATLDQAFAAAEQDNPLIRQAQFAEQASAAQLAAVKAETRPTFALQANLGYSGGNFGLATPFANYTHDVSATAVASFPLFTGGLTSSRIRQAAETNSVDRINIETTRRQVLLSVSRAWNQLLGARASLDANTQQVSAANIAFEGTRQEAEAGLRTTLDVLITAQDLRNAELALVGSRHDEYVAAAAVLEAAGALYARDLSAAAPAYDPKTNFDRVRHAWGWTPWVPAIAGIDRLGAPK